MAKRKQPTFTIPSPPEDMITEIATGQLQVDTQAWHQYNLDMIQSKKDWDKMMAGAEDDPDEIMRRLFKASGMF